MQRFMMALGLCSLGLLLGCGSSSGGASFKITNETVGANCPNGGKRIDATSSGGTTTIYACDGASGAIVGATAEPQGSNCPAGGVKLQTADGAMYVCNGTNGTAGPAGDAGPAGQDGQSVAVVAEPAGTNCPAGGFKLTGAGGTSYVCNGRDGGSGTGGVAVTLEAPGSNCPAGGYKLTSGASSSYVCNGGDGAPGQSVAVTPESAGTNCATGGYKLTSAGGISYLCNGATGAPGQSVAVTPEGAGTNCATGGYKLTSAGGISYLCNGATGATGAPGQSVSVTPESPGTSCPAGGYKMTSASGTSYVCNGRDGQSISVTVEPSGLHCPAGGYRLDTSTGSYYICNGVNGTSGGGGAGGSGGAGGAGGGVICEDRDNDGYYVGCASYGAIAGPDCDDSDATRYQWLTGYADQDGDGYTTGLGHTVCGGALLPPTYRATGTMTTDCNDADPDVWSKCSTCIDVDADGTYRSCDAWTRHSGPDCNDADQLVSPLMPELPDDGKDNDCAGDGDLLAGDGNGVFVATTGLDTNPGTRASPRRTLASAGTLAASNGTRRVYAAQGVYSENYQAAASLFGGYQAGTWSRDPVSNVSQTVGVVISGVAQGIVVDGMLLGSVSMASTAPAAVTRSRVNVSSATFGINGTAYPFVAAGNSVVCAACTGSSFTGIAAGGDAVLVGNTIQRTAATNTAVYALTLSGSSSALVAGNTIEPGRSNSTYEVYGIYGVGNRLFLDRNVIHTGENLYSNGYTYGIYISSPNVTTAVGNTIIGGGGASTYAIYQYQGDLILANNVIVDGPSQKFYGLYVSTSGSSGGTVHALSNVIHASKSALAYGVWMNAPGLDVSLMDNIIDLATSGSALRIAPVSGRLYNNDVHALPGACLIETPLAMSFCLVDIDDVNGCVAAGVCAESASNISVPPMFVSPATRDFHLQSSSLLINRGFDPVGGDGFTLVDRSRGPLGAISLYAASLGVRDPDGDTRPLGGRWDIGLDEWK